MLSRRSFGKQTLLGAAAVTAAGRSGVGLSAAAEPEPHFFVFLQIYGAWDVCLAFDPKDRNETFQGARVSDQPYDVSDIQSAGQIRLAPHGHALLPYANEMAIVNGIDMLVDNGHIPDAAMSGTQNARIANRAFVQAVLAAKHPGLRKKHIPHIYLSYDGQFFGGSYAAKSINATVEDFGRLFAARTDIGPRVDDSLLRRMLVHYSSNLPDSQSRLVFSNYIRSIDQSGEVAQIIRNTGYQPPEDANSPEAIGYFMGMMFRSGVLGSATVSLGSRYLFDTHSNHYEEHPLGKAVADMAAMIEELKKIPFGTTGSVYERTTFVLTGEYARTPLLNNFRGKDHNFRTNSVVFVGKNVRSAVHGASGPLVEGGNINTHAGLPIDFTTGLPKETGTILTMKDVWAGSGAIFGVDLSSDFGSEARPVKFL